MKEKISILILTYNAPKYVEETIVSLNTITNKEDLDLCEIIVVDNNSEPETKELLKKLEKKGYINKLFFSPVNTLFAKGNNIAASLSAENSDYYLLLNSDICIKNKNWLSQLVKAKKKGNYKAVSYGYCDSSPIRLDGYCFLIDKPIYDKYKLDEEYEWWWSVTKIQAEILKNEGNLLGFKNHNRFLIHYGGKSGNAFKNAKGMDVDRQKVLKWFDDNDNSIKIKSLKFFNNF